MGRHGRLRFRVAVNDAVTISVEDDGPGAPEALMNWLGQRGLRLDQKVPGTGLKASP